MYTPETVDNPCREVCHGVGETRGTGILPVKCIMAKMAMPRLWLRPQAAWRCLHGGSTKVIFPLTYREWYLCAEMNHLLTNALPHRGRRRQTLDDGSKVVRDCAGDH